MDNSLRVLLVFIHGFRGTDSTFKEFPEQVKTSILNLIPEAHVNIAIYPQFETRGSLSLAVDNFCSWLKEIEAHRRTQPGGSAPLLTILLGHSMGGLLAGDVYLKFLQEEKAGNAGSNSKHASAFPRIIGLLAFDSPFYGVCRSSLSRTAYSRVSSIGTQLNNAATGLGVGGAVISRGLASQSSKPSFRALALGGLAVVTAAAAAGAYMYKDQMPTLYSYVTDHLEFINALSKEEELNKRVKDLVDSPEVMFWCYYVEVKKDDTISRFINVPGESGVASYGAEYFVPIQYQCQDEVKGHTSIFNPTINNNYFIMAQKAVSSIHHAIRQFQAQSS